MHFSFGDDAYACENSFSFSSSFSLPVFVLPSYTALYDQKSQSEGWEKEIRLMNLFITSAPTLHTPVERLFGRRLLWMIACVACPPRLSFSFSFSAKWPIPKHEIRTINFRSFAVETEKKSNSPLSSPLRFFFSDTVTSVLIMDVSLLRSVELSTMADDDTTGADNGRETALVVVKSKIYIYIFHSVELTTFH